LLLLSSGVKEDNAVLTVDLTNPDIQRDGQPDIPQGTLHVLRTQLLWRGSLCDRLRIHNYGEGTVSFSLQVAFDADFADIFEARGMNREQRGRLLPPRLVAGGVMLEYEGLDGRPRAMQIAFDPPPASLGTADAVYDIELQPHGAATLRWTVSCDAGEPSQPGLQSPAGEREPHWYEEAAERMSAEFKARRAAEPLLRTSNAQFNHWLQRSLSDLHMLTTDTPYGRYPYAGVPWFSTPFGRDGIVTALQCLWFAPEIAQGVLAFLAATQATELRPEQDAQPGKILHEMRGGEMAALGEVPFGRYYGSVDATPLFVMLAGACFDRTGDLDFAQRLWPNVLQALHWIDEYGDVDGDGFVEYARSSPKGLVQQGWKDSHDSVFHADGSLAEGPIALSEVQGYVYAARLAAARLARALGDDALANRLEQQALALREQFEAVYWCDDLQTYALALDKRKRACRVRASNAGQCLFTGIVGDERAQRVADTLMDEPSFSGWGIRTVASIERRYNPMSYHNGSVWPHDNSLIAAGLGRYGLREHAGRIMSGLFDASLYFDLHRLPELFCGFTRRSGENPTLYPQACSPQAWAAAAPLMCLQSCLGMDVLGGARQVCLRNPWLPRYLQHVEIRGIRVGDASIDIVVANHDQEVGVRLMRREGDVELRVLL
ncbi:MAG TPA: amylo-alpha-1,6-glucosidase, partial [Burkholderiaceae bacterium]|nr:amylo-alpha-1,6-glucosidase [Burkholderiaceae bacterium]